MRKLGGTLATLLLVAAPALAGCGDEDKEATTATRAGAVTPAPAPQDQLPAELSGMWTATLKRTQAKDPPLHALKKQDLVFKLKFLGTGGVDNGPVLSVKTDDLELESVQPVAVSGSRITVDVPECQFAYAVKAEQLTWTAIGDDCPNDGLSAVLTAGPWQRTSG